MATQYQKIMSIDGSTISSFYDTVSMVFIPPDPRNKSYQSVLAYCAELGITLNDLDLFNPTT